MVLLHEQWVKNAENFEVGVAEGFLGILQTKMYYTLTSNTNLEFGVICGRHRWFNQAPKGFQGNLLQNNTL